MYSIIYVQVEGACIPIPLYTEQRNQQLSDTDFDSDVPDLLLQEMVDTSLTNMEV